VANSFVLLFSVPLRSLGRFDVEAGTTAWANAVVFCSVAVVLSAGGGPLAAAAAFALARLAALSLAWRSCHRAIGSRPWPSLDRASVGVMLRTGFPFGVHAAVGTLNMQADTIMIHHYLGAGPVGIYQAGMRVLVGALLVADALNGVYLARLARTGQVPVEFSRLGTQMTRHLLALGTIAFACTLAGSELIVHYLFDDGYAPLVRILPAFGVLMFIRYGGVSYGTVLTLSDRQGVRVAAVSGALALSLALNALLVPRYGLAGAIAASIIGHVALYSVYVVAAWQEHRSLLIDRRSVGLLAAAVASIAWLAALGPGSAALRLEIGAVLLAAGVLAGVTRAEWGSVAGRLTRQH
jgi:O-antigen/teichoic acid export membrane protein